MSIDPLAPTYPFYSTYAFSGNRVIDAVELEGLEPSHTSKENGYPLDDGTYAIAPVQGTEDYYGWNWNTSLCSWESCSSTEYTQNKSSSNDDDLNKDYDPDQWVYSFNIGFEDYFATFTHAFMLGTSLEQTDDDGILWRKFVSGNNSTHTFGLMSKTSELLSKDPAFVKKVEAFEQVALDYFRLNGDLSGFEGNNILKSTPTPYIKDTWFMHTVMGGTKRVDAQIRKISATEIQVKYTVWDHFGAGKKDATSFLPGLPSLYWLQHNSINWSKEHTTNFGDLSTKFIPFKWNVEVIRTSN
ncbi:MAG: hypothetical protein R3C61_15570 [Bacteroidia bacterium]